MRGKTSLRTQAELNGLCRGTVYLRMRKGMTKEQALKCPSPRQPVQDHEGTRFPSVHAMTQHWGIGRSTFRMRLARDWSLEKALTTPAWGRREHDA